MPSSLNIQTSEELRPTVDMGVAANGEGLVGDFSERIGLDVLDQRGPIGQAAARQNVFDGGKRKGFVVQVTMFHFFNPGNFDGSGIPPGARAGRHVSRPDLAACAAGSDVNSAENREVR